MKTLFTVVLTLTFLVSQAQVENMRKLHFNTKNNIVLNGYDPICYFEGKPKEGNKNLKFEYKGLIYQFSSQQNLDKFKMSPSKFEPVYGGWCAYAMGLKGEKVTVDPGTFKIIDGKLYLFYNSWGTNTLNSWNLNEKKLKDLADKHWQVILK